MTHAFQVISHGGFQGLLLPVQGGLIVGYPSDPRITAELEALQEPVLRRLVPSIHRLIYGTKGEKTRLINEIFRGGHEASMETLRAYAEQQRGEGAPPNNERMIAADYLQLDASGALALRYSTEAPLYSRLVTLRREVLKGPLANTDPSLVRDLMVALSEIETSSGASLPTPPSFNLSTGANSIIVCTNLTDIDTLYSEVDPSSPVAVFTVMGRGSSHAGLGTFGGAVSYDKDRSKTGLVPIAGTPHSATLRELREEAGAITGLTCFPKVIIQSDFQLSTLAIIRLDLPIGSSGLQQSVVDANSGEFIKRKPVVFIPLDPNYLVSAMFKPDLTSRMPQWATIAALQAYCHVHGVEAMDALQMSLTPENLQATYNSIPRSIRAEVATALKSPKTLALL